MIIARPLTSSSLSEISSTYFNCDNEEKLKREFSGLRLRWKIWRETMYGDNKSNVRYSISECWIQGLRLINVRISGVDSNLASTVGSPRTSPDRDTMTDNGAKQFWQQLVKGNFVGKQTVVHELMLYRHWLECSHQLKLFNALRQKHDGLHQSRIILELIHQINQLYPVGHPRAQVTRRKLVAALLVGEKAAAYGGEGFEDMDWGKQEERDVKNGKRTEVHRKMQKIERELW
ncbi:hypothetical protein BDZ97DRAFT_2026682 [Flammula alnicola]|nr:hypothetical protein BDZ97DRAFT_2026682 [Flammula alnicola]